MANLAKITRGSVGNILSHFERKDGVKFGNIEIKPHLSEYNYNLAPKSKLTQREILEKRLSEVKVLNRKNVNVLCSWVVTLPKSLERNKEAEAEFFKNTYEFLKDRYGEKNIVSAYVHKDETTPHLHFAFTPVVFDENKQIERLSAKDVIDRNELKQFHPSLDKHLKLTMPLTYKGDIFDKDNKKEYVSLYELKKENLNRKIESANSMLETYERIEKNRKKLLDQYVENISKFESKLTSSATINPVTREITITQEALGTLLETAKAGVDTRTKERELLNEVEGLKKEISGHWHDNYELLEKTISYNEKIKVQEFFLNQKGYKKEFEILSPDIELLQHLRAGHFEPKEEHREPLERLAEYFSDNYSLVQLIQDFIDIINEKIIQPIVQSMRM